MIQHQSIAPQYLALIEEIAREDPEAKQRVLEESRAEQKEIAAAMIQWLCDRLVPLNKQQIEEELRFDSPANSDEAIAAAVQQRLKNRCPSLHEHWVQEALLTLLRRKLPFEHNNIVSLLRWSANNGQNLYRGTPQILKTVENYLKQAPLTPDIQAAIAQLVEEKESWNGETRRWIAKFQELGDLKTTALPLFPGEAWAERAIADIQGTNPTTQRLWNELLTLCASASGSKPSTKWLQQAQPLQDEIDTLSQDLSRWFLLVDRPRTQPLAWVASQPYGDWMIHETNADVLKGLVWLCAQREPELARALATLAISVYRKLPGFGARCLRVGNACIWALGQMPGQEGLNQLAVLKVRLKLGTAQKAIEKALTAAAQRLGLPTDEIEELIVPTYGMEAVGVRREVLGEFTAELAVTGTNSTLRWFKADGKQKSVPKAVKQHYSEELKALKQDSKEIDKMLPAQRHRIESLYLGQKQWDLSTWQERYLNHPLIGTLARRLIWRFKQGDRSSSGIWFEERIVAQDGQPLGLTASTQVELWHPIHDTQTVTAWRNWLVEHSIQQPFKQAHREIYLLTDAERQTGVYSNRFAAHIIKQHQFNSLCGARGWKNSLRLMVDDTYPPATRELPAWGLRAEFWVEGIGDDYGVDTNDTGTYLYLATDQVRFYQLDAPANCAHASGRGYYAASQANEPLSLEEIPPLVFTEMMRDVDLFVGVASVGNDPTWYDGGAQGRDTDYWTDYSFGELSETAQTRKQVLEKLLPRLKIGVRCQISDKFLVVQGELRTYKIHLGSGNILMSPNDQYLCIVPSPGVAAKEAGQVFLPFEGDNRLAVILSKAFLLAADSQIQDPTILSQIRKG